MLKINFLPDSNRKDYLAKIDSGIVEYKDIWEKDGKRMTQKIEEISNLKFQEDKINAIVYISSSLYPRSFPLSLRADFPKNVKKGLLVHELCHRLLSGNKVKIASKDYLKNPSLEIHKVINLVLYDSLLELYGEAITRENIKWESKSRSYKKAWDWVLSLNKVERKDLFKTSIKH